MEYMNKKIAIVGFGVEGQSSAEYFSRCGAKITVLDSNENCEVESGYRTELGEEYLKNIEKYDLVVRSPSIRPDLIKSAKQITTATQIFFDNCKGNIIGITGTKGKGTTSSLIAALLESQGVKTWLGGNIGVPMLSFLDEVKPGDAVVLELSSFQLIDLNARAEIAVCLMIEPDHMNWHQDMAEYIAAKAGITTNQLATDVTIYDPSNQNTAKAIENSLATMIPALNPEVQITNEKVVFNGHELLKTEETGLIGRHNLENISSALNVLNQYAQKHSIDIDYQAVSRVIREFKGLPNRLEFVRELDGVSYINDSYSSTPSAAIAGIEAVAKPIIAIIGGVDKGVELDYLAKDLSSIKHTVLIGETASIIEVKLKSLGASNFTVIGGDMRHIVKTCQNLSEPGDSVLLSPGSSSFDMFRNFTDRGNQFREVVSNL